MVSSSVVGFCWAFGFGGLDLDSLSFFLFEEVLCLSLDFDLLDLDSDFLSDLESDFLPDFDFVPFLAFGLN